MKASIIAMLALAVALPSGAKGLYSHQRCATCARVPMAVSSGAVLQKHEFQRSHPCPSTGGTSRGCPGYVIDHVVPLKRGGADAPSNMQWQTKAQAAIKGKTE